VAYDDDDDDDDYHIQHVTGYYTQHVRILTVQPFKFGNFKLHHA